MVAVAMVVVATVAVMAATVVVRAELARRVMSKAASTGVCQWRR